MVTVDTFLEHHGVRGQKWGVRNRRKPVIFESGKEWRSRPASQRWKVGAVAGAGVVVSQILTRNAKLPIRLLANATTMLVGIEATTRILEKSRKTPMKKISSGQKTPRQLDKELGKEIQNAHKQFKQDKRELGVSEARKRRTKTTKDISKRFNLTNP